MPSRNLTRFLFAGAVVGLLGVVLFGAIHAIIIVPIWTRLVGGIPFGLAAGLAMGWALYELRASGRLGAGVGSNLAFGLGLWLTLLPMTVFGILIRAIGIHGVDNSWEVVAESVLAFGTGVAAGRLFSGQWRGAVALGIASLSLAFAQAGPIAVMNSGRAAALFAALGVVYLISVVALGWMASRTIKSVPSSI